jgi:hypothetical protein
MILRGVPALSSWSYVTICSAAHRFLHEFADPRLFDDGQLLQREDSRPHGAFIEALSLATLGCEI